MPEGSIDQFSPSPKEYISLEQIMQWNKGRHPIQKYGDKYSVVILGEHHWVPEIEAEQLELIRLVKPEFVLCEFLSGYMYDPRTRKFEEQKGRIITDDIDHIVRTEEQVSHEMISLANEMDFKIIGCDLTNAEIRKVQFQLTKKFPERYTWDDEIGEAIDTKNRNNILMSEVRPARDEQMAKTILEYHKKSKKPIPAIMGRRHSQNIHNQKLLQGKDFGYIYVDQTKK